MDPLRIERIHRKFSPLLPNPQTVEEHKALLFLFLLDMALDLVSFAQGQLKHAE